jgi:serine phosphatase RsbU (regulator of sigma subunit)/catechol 2,3-dioxygenase-like lactoylglutathione lyase family enzyme
MGSSPSPSEVERQEPYLGINAVNIFVRDQERSLRFYLDQLGFRLAFDARLQSGERWVAVSPPDGTAVLALIAPEPDSREYALIGRRTHVVLVTEDVLAKYREWSKRGVHFRFVPRLRRVAYEPHEPRPQSTALAKQPGAQSSVWGGVFTRFEDLDRNTFELMSFDEVSLALVARRRAAAEKLEAERRAAQELEIAKQVQARLFPQKPPALRTLEYAGICIQAREVGGDYYDFLDLGKDRFGLVIGDIAGKGIAAALLMANLQANLRSQCAIAFDKPRCFLQAVNELFCENTADSAYATLFFAQYDDGTQRLRYVNCGHLSALLLRQDNTVERLDSTATVLGLFPQWDCVIQDARLFAGDNLVIYTDGVTEAVNPGGEDFGEHRLIEALRRHHELSSEAMLKSIVDEVREFSPCEQHDDITLIAARCKATT